MPIIFYGMRAGIFPRKCRSRFCITFGTANVTVDLAISELN